MAYTNPSGNSAYTPSENISGQTIAQDTNVPVETPPYARFLYLGDGVSGLNLSLISAGTALVYKDSLLSGGTIDRGGINLYDGGTVRDVSGTNARIYVYGGTISGGRFEGGTYFISFEGGVMSGVHIANNRKINVGAGTTYDLVVSGGYQTVSGGAAYRTTVLNGGSMILTAGGTPTIVDLVAGTGAKLLFNTPNFTLGGANTRIAAGTINTNAAAHTDENGVLQDFGVSGAVTFTDRIKLHDLTLAAGADVTMNTGAEVDTVSISDAATAITVSSGAILKNASITGTGNVNILYSGTLSGATLSGADAAVTNAEGARLYGLTLTGGASLALANGALLADAQAEAGNSIDLSTLPHLGGEHTNVASGVFLGNFSTVAVSEGHLTGLAINSERLYLNRGITVDGGSIGGTAQLILNAGVVASGVGVGGTAKTIANNGAILRGINAAGSGAVVSALEGGTIEGGVFTGGAGVWARNGSLVSGAVLSDGAVLSAVDATVNVNIHSGGSVILRPVEGTQGAQLVGATASGTGIFISAGVGTFISGGTFIGDGARLSADGGVKLYVTSATADGITLGGNTFLDELYGAVVRNAVITDSATLRVRRSGALLVGASTLESGYVSAWANTVISSCTFGGNIAGSKNNNLVLAAGAAMSDCTVSGANVYINSSGADIGVNNTTMYDGLFRAYGENVKIDTFTASGGSVYIQSGAVSKLTVGGDADAEVYAATLNDAATEGAGYLLAGSGAVLSGGTFGGDLATGWNLRLYAGASMHGAVVDGARVYIGNNGADIAITDLTMRGGIFIAYYDNVSISGATVSGGQFSLRDNATASSIKVSSGGVFGVFDAQSGAAATDVTIHSGGSFYLSSGGTALNLVTESGAEQVRIKDGVAYAGAEVWNAEVFNTGVLEVGSGAVARSAYVSKGGTLNAAAGATVADLRTAASGHVTFAKGALFQGSGTEIAEGTLFFGTTAVAGHAESGVITGLDAGTAQFQLSVGDGIVVRDAVGNHTSVRISAFDGASIQGATMYKGAIICNAGASGTMEDVTLTGAGQMNLSGTAHAERTVIENGGKLFVNAATASFDNTILKAGGTINFSNTALTSDVDTGKSLTIDYTGAAVSSATITWLDRIAASTTVLMKGIDAAGTYGIATSSGTLAKVSCVNGLYADVVNNGASYTNGIVGLTYGFDGTTLTAADAGIVTAETATKLTTSGSDINSDDRAVKWDANTGYSGNVFLADGMTAGNAWLKLDGFANTAANLYGTGKDQDFAGTVNIGASKGTIKNLAAGAALGGKVGGVKLTVEDGMRVTGAVYAGGMGDVTGATETLVQGGAFGGNVFAGALCNYAANTTATATGDINLTVNGGTFANNLYAGAAVKAGAATGVVHTVQNISVELNDGTASRPSFCVYGGGYATGTTESKVYAAGDVDITVTGGSWGKYQSGRGIFGGVYTDKVAASVEDVNINVSGGTLGNIYGGGWAQNGGTSTAGNVSITVAGDAEVNNVFGGGCYSTTGGATGVGNVEIVVAGGSIANNIFAGGFGENSTVAGDVSVTFRGSNAYSCNVYGYITPENAASAQDKLLSFDGFTGSVAGSIGGFDSIEFANDTAATLSGAIDNGAWSFDYTGRTLDTAAVALTGGTFTGDALTLKLDATDAPADWNIASGLADTAIGFDYEVYVGGAQQTFDDGKIASGDYAGWGFALEDSTLKFKNLA